MTRHLSTIAFALAVATTLSADKFADIEITPLVHSSVQIEYRGKVIHVDPWSRADLSKAKPADLILITDDPLHHLDAVAIARLRKPGAPVVLPTGIHWKGKSEAETQAVGNTTLANGESRMFAGVLVEAIASYDLTPGEPYHPKGEANGYIITLGATRIYLAGVTQCVPEVKAVKNISVAFFPLNLPLDRMEAPAAIECLRAIKPRVVYPYHYDQTWAATASGAKLPVPTTKGLQEVKTALQTDGIEVRLASWDRSN